MSSAGHTRHQKQNARTLKRWDQQLAVEEFVNAGKARGLKLSDAAKRLNMVESRYTYLRDVAPPVPEWYKEEKW